MKKNIYSLWLLALSVLLITSCAEDDEFTKFTQKYVAFTATSAQLEESQSVVSADGEATQVGRLYTVELVRNSNGANEPLTVTLNITSQYLDETPFSLPGEDASDAFEVIGGTSVTFEPGEYTKSITLQTINDVTPSGNKEVVIAIASVSDDSYNIGLGESNRRTELTVTLIDDDCPIDIPNNLAGKWTVTSFCAAPGSFNEGFCRGDQVGQEVELIADDSDPLGTTAIISGGIHADPMVLKFITCPGQVAINSNYTLAFTQNGAPALIGPTDEPAVYGTGSYSEESGKISVVVSYGNTASGLVFDEFIIEYEKND